jgi:hypothetical protein
MGANPVVFSAILSYAAVTAAVVVSQMFAPDIFSLEFFENLRAFPGKIKSAFHLFGAVNAVWLKLGYPVKLIH